jgi:hypothetical protein
VTIKSNQVRHPRQQRKQEQKIYSVKKRLIMIKEVNLKQLYQLFSLDKATIPDDNRHLIKVLCLDLKIKST